MLGLVNYDYCYVTIYNYRKVWYCKMSFDTSKTLYTMDLWHLRQRQKETLIVLYVEFVQRFA